MTTVSAPKINPTEPQETVSKVISLHEWKSIQKENQEIKGYAKYLAQLDMESLLQETKILTEEVEATEINRERVQKGQVFLREFTKRLLEASPLMAQELMRIRVQIEDHIESIEKHIQ